MHILRLRGEDDTGEARAEAEAILAQLHAYVGDDFTGYFHTLMHEQSEDLGGLMGHPDGYLFMQGQMVPEFYEGTRALELGGLSGVIETSFGYHIIHRLPVNYDAVPFNLTATVRHMVAQELFDIALRDWIDNMETTFSEAWERLDIAELFSN